MRATKTIKSAFGVSEIFAIIGTGGISYGAWLVYEPAGFIVGGALVLTAGLLAARSRAHKEK